VAGPPFVVVAIGSIVLVRVDLDVVVACNNVQTKHKPFWNLIWVSGIMDGNSRSGGGD